MIFDATAAMWIVDELHAVLAAQALAKYARREPAGVHSGSMMRAMVGIALACVVSCGGRTPMGSYDGGAIEDGSGGAGGGMGQDAFPTCTSGTTTFHLRAADGRNSSYCVGLGCSTEWAEISSLGGDKMPISLGCNPNCTECRQVDCPAICPAPVPMKPDGERFVWDGTYWPSRHCGMGLSCRFKYCANPGHYQVKMCAGAGASAAGLCATDLAQRCITLEFNYPSATPVEGAI